jgi:DNA-binding response OmpR family regulator
MQPTRSILLAEEVATTRAFLADNLTADGYRVLELLAHLAADPVRVFTKDELLRDVWGFRLPARTRTVDSHTCRLRRKLAATADGRFVRCVWGVATG